MERKIGNDNYLIIKLEDEPPEITSPDPPNNSQHYFDGELENHLNNSLNGSGSCNNITSNFSFHNNQTANTR